VKYWDGEIEYIEDAISALRPVEHPVTRLTCAP
jgi:hypothetical protein